MIPTITPSALADRIDSARRSQQEWAGQTVRQRLQPVERFRLLLVQQCDAVCAAVERDVGKKLPEVLGGELLPAADACRFLLREAPRLLRPRRVSSRQCPWWLAGQSDAVHRGPRGVVGVIGTWNYPLFLNAVPILHALVAGNAIVWKPSEQTPHLPELLTGLLHQAGFPPEAMQVLPVAREMGPALADAAVDHIVFTGSAAVGRKLASHLGERLISSTLELSGCDVQLVLQDADVQMAARAAWFGCTINRGQTCIAVRRAFVHAALYPAYCEALRALAAGAPGMPLQQPSDLQQANRLVADALSAGARLLVERTPDDSGRCAPAVVVDARPEMALCREAAFAPVMAVLPFSSIEEALRLESACPYALGASIFTRSSAVAEQIASRLRAGSVTVNDVVLSTAHPATPFGGRGASGWGVTQGAEGLLEMTVPQTVSIRRGAFRPHYDAGDPGKQGALEELFRALLQATHAPGFLQRMHGWQRLIRQFWRGL